MESRIEKIILLKCKAMCHLTEATSILKYELNWFRPNEKNITEALASRTGNE